MFFQFFSLNIVNFLIIINMPGENNIVSFDKYISYPIAKKVAPICYKIDLKPNHVTFLNIIFRFFILKDLVKNNATIKTLLCCILSHIIDCLDGTIARTYKQYTDIGKYMDIIADLLFWPILILIITIKNYGNDNIIHLSQNFIMINQFLVIISIISSKKLLNFIEMNGVILIIVFYYYFYKFKNI